MYEYGWDGNFNEINVRLNFDNGQLTPSTKDSTWFATADAWQYLWVEGDSTQKVDNNNGRQKLQGVGVFSRVQFAGKDTNPVDYIICVGVNAKGQISRRDNDNMGHGYSYTKLQSARFLNAIGIENTSIVVELF